METDLVEVKDVEKRWNRRGDELLKIVLRHQIAAYDQERKPIDYYREAQILAKGTIKERRMIENAGPTCSRIEKMILLSSNTKDPRLRLPNRYREEEVINPLTEDHRRDLKEEVMDKLRGALYFKRSDVENYDRLYRAEKKESKKRIEDEHKIIFDTFFEEQILAQRAAGRKDNFTEIYDEARKKYGWIYKNTALKNWSMPARKRLGINEPQPGGRKPSIKPDQ